MTKFRLAGSGFLIAVSYLIAVVAAGGCKLPEKSGYKHYLTGARYLREEKLDGAVLELEKALESGFKEAFVENDLGVALMKTGRREKAEEHLRTAAQKDLAFSRPFYNLALLYRQNATYEKALAAVKEAVKRGMPVPEYYLLQARLEVKLKKTESAERTLRTAVQKYPGHHSALHDLGVVCVLLGKSGEAERLLKTATGFTDTSKTAFFNLGLLYKMGTKPEKPLPPASAESFLNIAMNNPESSEALFELGKTYLLLSAKIDQERKKEVAQAFAVLGEIERKRGNLSKAMRAYETAIKLEPKNISALKNLGMLYGHLGNISKARTLFEKILSIKPNKEEVREMLNALSPPEKKPPREAPE